MWNHNTLATSSEEGTLVRIETVTSGPPTLTLAANTWVIKGTTVITTIMGVAYNKLDPSTGKIDTTNLANMRHSFFSQGRAMAGPSGPPSVDEPMAGSDLEI
jgi:hypothetical protein